MGSLCSNYSTTLLILAHLPSRPACGIPTRTRSLSPPRTRKGARPIVCIQPSLRHDAQHYRISLYRIWSALSHDEAHCISSYLRWISLSSLHNGYPRLSFMAMTEVVESSYTHVHARQGYPALPLIFVPCLLILVYMWLGVVHMLHRVWVV